MQRPNRSRWASKSDGSSWRSTRSTVQGKSTSSMVPISCNRSRWLSWGPSRQRSMPGPVTAYPSPGSSRIFHGRLKIQLQGQCRHRPIETDHGSATFAANEVQVPGVNYVGGSISRSGWFPCRLSGKSHPSVVTPPRSPPTANARSRSAGLRISTSTTCGHALQIAWGAA